MSTPPKPPGEVTRLLQEWHRGDESARDQLIPVVYQELRRRAAAHLRRERRDQALRPTELVHETYLRLCGQNAAWQNRDQFFGVASRLMRRILVDHARARGAAKRGNGVRVVLDERTPSPRQPAEPELLDLDAALDELAALDARQAHLVELRYFGGLSIDETARVLGVSVATANRDWVTARAWLYHRLTAQERP